MEFARTTRLAALFLVVSLALCGTSSFAVTVELAHHDAPRRQQWELLSVTITPPAGGTAVAVQDARGGLTVSRPTSSGAADPVTGDLRIQIPLPYLADAELPAALWPVDLTIQSPTGAQRLRIDVSRPATVSIAPGGRASFRVIVPLESGGDLMVPQPLSPLPIVTLPHA